ncbi:MAG TPA: hypothetical protein PKA33_01755 [Amaricoccus sp.]|uniref:DUF6950 family protein n=1 Tax=Amaricoccus sp. TaxID=1872485 RepID=UPI002CDDB89C|nr:hypothetical protein [Amaricoccus sp.]HMR51180.1 hypothetical protein [Amaricoccus sp.]HMT98072.1 hypothetical protein [Amaricoccus sp.]
MRPAGWRGRLHAYLAEVRGRPFRYGEHDCALFAAGAVAAMTERDPAAELRGHYRTLRAGLKAVNAAGYIDHVDMAKALFPAIHPSQARAGDLAVVESESGPALGVVGGPMVFVLRQEGMAQVPLMAAAEALRV